MEDWALEFRAGVLLAASDRHEKTKRSSLMQLGLRRLHQVG